MAVVSVASAAIGTYTQMETAKVQTKLAQQQSDAQQEELQSAADQQAGERVKQSRIERARMLVAAGESGLQGQSFEVSLMDNAARLNEDMANIAKQTGFSSRAIDANTQSTLAGISRPNALTAGLQMAQAGASGWETGAKIKTAYNELKIKG